MAELRSSWSWKILRCPSGRNSGPGVWLTIRAIFARAIGLNAVFADAPDRALLADDFIRNYHQFADHMFACKQSQKSISRHVDSADFDFEMFASGEYSRMLERQWQEQ